MFFYVLLMESRALQRGECCMLKMPPNGHVKEKYVKITVLCVLGQTIRLFYSILLYPILF